MDSLTQVVLGAAVGEATLGKKVGNKALLWGAIGGTIPDLDVFVSRLYSDVDALFVHRGFSHSILFALIMGPLLGYLLSKLYKGKEAGFKGWSMLFFWSIFTHPLLDIFTNYGTGLFEPFSNYRVAFNTIFVIDPLYTLPMMVACLAVLFFSRTSDMRRKINWTGIVLSSLYLSFTVWNKTKVDRIVEQNLQQGGIAYETYRSQPAPLTNILWTIVVKQQDAYQVGYYSLWDSDDSIRFKEVPQNEHLLAGLAIKQPVQDLIRFSKGYYALQQEGDRIIFNDLRFSTMRGWFDLSTDYIFSFWIKPEDGTVKISRKEPEYVPTKDDLAQLFRRISGDQMTFEARRP